MAAAVGKVLAVGDSETDGKGPIHGAQWLLAGDNVFDENYDPGTIDRVFGQQTGNACVRAKTALSYPDVELKPTFGDKLRGFLAGDVLLPGEFDARRAERQSQPAVAQKFVYPAAVKVALIGRPGGGTHSWTVDPNNWPRDNAWGFAFPLR